MATIAKLMVELGLEDNTFARGLDGARSKLDAWGASLRRTGGFLTAAVTAPLVAAGIKVLQLAGNYEQAVGKTEAVFGSSSKSMLDWSKTSADAFGLTNTEALAYSSTMGALFRVMDFSQPIAADMSQNLVQLAGDMAAFNDISTSRASEAIIAGLSGEYMSLRSMGVFLNEASVNQEALNIAMADGRDEITEADKVMARYNLIMEQTTQQQGQFARESTGLSGRMAILRARILNVATAFGVRMIPMANSVLGVVSKLLDRFDALGDGTKNLILIVAGLAAAMGPLLIVIGMMLPGLSALLGVIGFLLSPIGLVVAAVAALAWVFRGELLTALNWVIDKVREFVSLWQSFKSQGLDPVQAGLVALATMFPALGAVIAPIRQMVENLGDAFRALLDGNYSAALDSLIAAFRNLGSAIKAAWNSLDWGAIVSALGDLAGALASWLWEQASAVDWGGVIGAAASKAGDITKTIVSKLGDLGVALFVWLWNAASSIPWGDVLTAAMAFGDVVGTIITKIGDLGASLKTWYDNAIDSVNWAGLGETVGSKIGDLTRTLAPKAGELIQGFLDKVTDPGLWSGIGTALLTMILAVPVAIGYLGMTLAPKALEFLQGFVTGLDINWYLVSIWMLTMGAKLLTAIGDLSATLVSKGIELISGFLQGLSDRWPAIVIWLALTGTRAFQAVGSLLATLLSKGIDLLQGFLDGLNDKWPTISSWLGMVATMAIGAIGSLIATLLQKGRDLLSGLYTGIIGKWEDARSFLAGIPGKAVSAVGSLASTLYSAGASLIQGLIDGITSKIGALTSKLGEITSLIPDWKGPPERDRKLLEPTGRMIMGGLSRGLDDGWQDVTRQLSSYVPSISSDASGGLSAGREQVIQIITLEPGKWAEFLANATAGGEFARRLGPEMGLEMGDA